MAKFEIVPGLTFVDRAGWGADAALARRGRKVARGKRTHVIIHHTVVVDQSDDSPNVWNRESQVFRNMRRLQTIRPDLSLDVPYSFVAYFMKRRDSVMICEGRGEDRTGAHTKGHNTAGIGIALAGNFENESVDGIEFAKRMHLISAFLGWLRFDPSHPDYGQFRPMKNLGQLQPKCRRVFIHQDFKNTACPGTRLIPHLSMLDFVDPRCMEC